MSSPIPSVHCRHSRKSTWHFPISVQLSKSSVEQLNFCVLVTCDKIKRSADNQLFVGVCSIETGQESWLQPNLSSASSLFSGNSNFAQDFQFWRGFLYCGYKPCSVFCEGQHEVCGLSSPGADGEGLSGRTRLGTLSSVRGLSIWPRPRLLGSRGATVSHPAVQQDLHRDFWLDRCSVH